MKTTGKVFSLFLRNRVRSHWQVMTLVLLCVVSLTGWAEPTPEKISKENWYLVETENFSVISEATKGQTRRLVKNLEMFRALVNVLNHGRERVRTRPVKVYIADSYETYSLLCSNSPRLLGADGFFRDALNGNYAVVRYFDSKSVKVLFHEYVHYLVANSSTGNLPFWYSEGVAEFLAQIEFKNKNVVTYGNINRRHLAVIAYYGWIEAETLFRKKSVKRENQDQIGLFYSMSWLAVHFFRSSPERATQMRQYLSLTQKGMDEAEALMQSTGQSFEELNEELWAYARNRRFDYSKIKLKDSLLNEELVIEKLKPHDVAYRLGDYFLRAHGDNERADKYFDRVLELSPTHARSLAGKAKIAIQDCPEDDCAKAMQFVDMAKAADASDAYVNTVNGHVSRSLMELDSPPSSMEELRKSAVKSYNKAINSGDLNLEAINAAAAMYALEERWLKAKELYEIVYFNAPSNYMAQISMIDVLIELKDIDSADRIAEKIRHNSHMSENFILAFEEWYQELIERKD